MKSLNNKFLPTLLVISAIFLVLACSGHKKLKDDKTYIYKCEDGGEFTAIVHQDKDQTIIRTGDEQYILDITPSGSGEKYSDGMNSFWTKGDEAVLELKGKKVYKGCKVIK